MKYITTFEATKSTLGRRSDKFAKAVKNDDIILINKMIADEINQDEGVFILIAVLYNDKKTLKKLLKKVIELNSLTQSAGYTPLIFASFQGYYDCMFLLIEAGADWNIKDDSNFDFLTYLHPKIKKEIIEKYPEKYKEYLFKKDAENYNL